MTQPSRASASTCISGVTVSSSMGDRVAKRRHDCPLSDQCTAWRLATDHAFPTWPIRPSLVRPDVLVEMKEVVRVVAELERGEPRQLVGRVRAAYASLALVAEDVDVDATGVRLQRGAEATGCIHPLLIFGRVGPGSRGDELH